MQTYEKDRIDKAEQAEAAVRGARESQAYFQFVAAERTVVPCTATWSAIKAYFGTEEVTFSALQESFQNPAFKAMLALRSPEQDRLQSLSTIQEITGSVPITAQYSSNEELAAKAAELESKREMRKKSPEELRQIIRESQKEVNRIDPFPPEYTRAVILKMEPLKLRALLRRFGQRVNDRIAEIS